MALHGRPCHGKEVRQGGVENHGHRVVIIWGEREEPAIKQNKVLQAETKGRAEVTFHDVQFSSVQENQWLDGQP